MVSSQASGRRRCGIGVHLVDIQLRWKSSLRPTATTDLGIATAVVFPDRYTHHTTTWIVSVISIPCSILSIPTNRCDIKLTCSSLMYPKGMTFVDLRTFLILSATGRSQPIRLKMLFRVSYASISRKLQPDRSHHLGRYRKIRILRTVAREIQHGLERCGFV